ncbi:uncharacterized protein THITE_117634 [Thermothielavioides terrestris NRRL 8126]|uniref:Uncharacterized protein n=2 Tax=Thermothielavioides terrestris TaxID=2587410 RepID=G2R819_THETT|nr:uncharacterized protein THITE_117634 [Thermothielavioides terrestris NRRL 8126]AEO68078.1 hypothetical protein THITE_117634 [Thermothielavioides terrestris NRRL 8126]
MAATNALLAGHHHQQVVAMMTKKFQDLLDYDKTKNHRILHVDWVAGNPDDPAVKDGSESAASGGMSAEDRRLSESVARSVMRITHGVPKWEPTMTWNRAMFFGDWLNDHKGFRQHYIEIQVKRISGSDDELLKKCGISPEFVWLSLHDEKAAALTPIVVPPLVPAPARKLPVPRADPPKIVPRPLPEVKEEEEEQRAAPASADDKGKGKAVAVPANDQTGAAADSSSARPDDIPTHPQPASASSESAQSPQKPTPLPDVGNLALGQQATDDTASSSAAGLSRPRAGIPRTQNLPCTGSFDNLPGAESQPPNGHDGNDDDEEGSVYLDDDENPFDSLVPAHESTAISAADLLRHRQEFDRNARVKREELDRIFAFHKDPAFIARKKKSFIYSVRVVAVPDRNDVVNVFTGPPAQNRYGTLLAQGGWVVPPVDERVQWREDHKRAYRNKGAKPGKYEGLPRPTVQHAMPMMFDWSGVQEPRYFGPPPPVWRELCEPCLEDIYWMVWQLLAGRQYLGFNPGTGFGLLRGSVAGDPELLAKCPFKSPSVEAQYHAASYPRGDETKKN